MKAFVRIALFRTSILPLVFYLSFMNSPAIADVTRDLGIPDAYWTATIEQVHGADPIYIIEVSPDYEWPEEFSGMPVHYRVKMHLADGTVIEVGRVIEEERFNVAVSVPKWMLDFPELLDEAGHLITRIGKAQLLTSKLIGAKKIESERFSEFVKEIENIIDAFEIDAQIIKHPHFSLVPYARDIALGHQDREPGKPQKPKYDWNKKVDDEQDQCHGLMPRECARKMISDIYDKHCSPSKPGFRTKCAKLKALIARTPSRPSIQCSIKTAVGSTGADGNITLSGDDFLTSTCASATLFHELHHALQTKVEFPKWWEYRELLVQHADLAADVKKPNLTPAKQKAAEDAFLKQTPILLAKMKGIETAAAREKVKYECDAFFFTIDNASDFSYPSKEGTKWMKANIKTMALEIYKIYRNEFKISFAKDPAACSCFTRIGRWFRQAKQKKHIKPNFDKDKFGASTWTSTLETLETAACAQ